jgi:hypothetical protein
MNQTFHTLMLYTQDFQENYILSNYASNVCSYSNDSESFVPFLFIFWIYSLIGFVTIIIWRYMNEQETICYSSVSSSYSVLDQMKELLDHLSLLSEEEKLELQQKFYLEANLLSNQFRIQVYENLLEKNK